MRQIAVSIFLSGLVRVFFVPNNNIANPSVRGFSPSDAFWRTTIGRPNFRSPRLCPPEAGKAEGIGSIRECRPLVRQNKVGGGKAPDQPEWPAPTNLKDQIAGPNKTRIKAFFVNCYLSYSPVGASHQIPGDQREVSKKVPFLQQTNFCNSMLELL